MDYLPRALMRMKQSNFLNLTWTLSTNKTHKKENFGDWYIMFLQIFKNIK